MRISYSTIKALIHYALIYLLLTLNGAMIFVQNRNLILYFVVLLYGALCVLFNSSGKYNKKEPLLYVAFLLFFVFFVRVVSGGIGIDSWLLYTGQVLIVYLCCYFNRDEFLNRFVILTVVMAAVSILCFMVQIFDRTLLLNLLKAESYVPLSDGRVFSYKGILLYTLPTHIESMRNTSFYSEPGRVQAMLHGALFCCLFMQPYLKLSSKKIIACVVILVIAVLTTQSATGYIGLLILLIGFLIRKPDRLRKIYDSKLKRKIIFFVFLIVIFLLVDYIRNGSARKSLMDTYQDYCERGKAEIKLLKSTSNVIGRTSWDRACTYLINSEANYYHCNEILRSNFYTGKWEYGKCEKHSIMLSQGTKPIKGLQMAIKAMSIIVGFYPDTIMYVAGNNILDSKVATHNSYAKYIKGLIGKYNLANKVVFTGALQAGEMKQRMLNSNVFLLPSSIENSPNSLGEAMMLGVPCVASDVGGVSDMMEHEEEGYIYPFNEYYKMAYYIIEIFNKEAQIEEMGFKAARKARITHNPENNTKELLEIYHKVVQGR